MFCLEQIWLQQTLRNHPFPLLLFCLQMWFCWHCLETYLWLLNSQWDLMKPCFTVIMQIMWEEESIISSLIILWKIVTWLNWLYYVVLWDATARPKSLNILNVKEVICGWTLMISETKVAHWWAWQGHQKVARGRGLVILMLHWTVLPTPWNRCQKQCVWLLHEIKVGGSGGS